VPALPAQDSARPAAGELHLAAEPAKLVVAREYAHQAAAAFGLDPDRCYEFVFAVNEAVTNAIRHGMPDEQGHICLSVHADAEHLTLAIRDYGSFRAPEADTGQDAASLDHGRGFALMAGLMDTVQLCVASGSTTVRLSTTRA
jgi:anti-sigma regulatory factor (Ser/Thr protein kinase)